MNYKNIFKLSLLVFVFLISFSFASSVFALNEIDPQGATLKEKQQTTDAQKLPNPLGITDLNALIARVINFVLSLVGSVSLLMFVYGGLTWMTSAGSSTKIQKGRDIIVWSIIGLAIVFSSYILVKFVVTSLVS